MPNRCPPKPFADPARGPRWSGWGVDAGNSRFQPAAVAGLTAAEVPKLELKWAFGFPNGTSAFGQPAVAGGRVFVGVRQRLRLRARRGDAAASYWSFQAQAGVRTAISIGSIGTAAAPRYAIYFGDLKGNVYAVDAETGALVWTKRADTASDGAHHRRADARRRPALRAAVVARGRSGANPKYECCTFRGGVVAFDARTGEQIWQSVHDSRRAEEDEEELDRHAAVGAGGRGGLVVADDRCAARRCSTSPPATGTTIRAAETSDAVIAFDLKTGKLRWSKQVTPNDAFVVGCGANAADPRQLSRRPRARTSTSATRRSCARCRTAAASSRSARSRASAGGSIPTSEGAILWQHRVGKGSALGGMEWGSAADDQHGYFPVADAQFGPTEAGGLYALRLATGEEVWHWQPPTRASAGERSCVQAQSAAITVIPGVVFSGTTNGMMRAYSTADGKVLWETNTAQAFQTVNGVAAKGGAINGPGPVIAGGMMFTNSGYAYLGAIGGALPGNVLLAYGVE